MRWPIDVSLPQAGERWRGAVQQDVLCVERLAQGHLEYMHGESTRYMVGLPAEATSLRFVPHAGSLPLLLFPQTRLLCPARGRLEVAWRIPLVLRLGVGVRYPFELLVELPPKRSSKALYGPVDAGRLCRSVRSQPYISIAQACAEVYPVSTKGEEESGIEPPDEVWLADPPPLIMPMQIENTTQEPLEVSKIMVPLELIGMYQDHEALLSGAMRMRLLSAQEAELSYVGAPTQEARAVQDLRGELMSPASRVQLFAHSYRNKTGLDFGF